MSAASGGLSGRSPDGWFASGTAAISGRPGAVSSDSGCKRDGLARSRSRGEPIWSTHTAGTGRSNHFAIQNDGNLVVYTAGGHVVWASRSTAPVLTTGQHLDPGHRLRTKESRHAWVSLTMHRSG